MQAHELDDVAALAEIPSDPEAEPAVAADAELEGSDDDCVSLPDLDLDVLHALDARPKAGRHSSEHMANMRVKKAKIRNDKLEIKLKASEK